MYKDAIPFLTKLVHEDFMLLFIRRWYYFIAFLSSLNICFCERSKAPLKHCCWNSSNVFGQYVKWTSKLDMPQNSGLVRLFWVTYLCRQWAFPVLILAEERLNASLLLSMDLRFFLIWSNIGSRTMASWPWLAAGLFTPSFPTPSTSRPSPQKPQGHGEQGSVVNL